MDARAADFDLLYERLVVHAKPRKSARQRRREAPRASRRHVDALESAEDPAPPVELSPLVLAAVKRLGIARNLRHLAATCTHRSPRRLAAEIAALPARAQQLLDAYTRLRRDRARASARPRDRRLGERVARVERIAAKLFQRMDRGCCGEDVRVLGDVLFVSPPAGQSLIAYSSEPNPVPLPPS